MIKSFFLIFLSLAATACFAQLHWTNVDSRYGPLPPSVHIYYAESSPDTGAFRAYYLIADLKDKKLQFTTDTTNGRRITPTAYYNRNAQPLVVVNGTFFSFETNRNLNLVIKDGNIDSYNVHQLHRKQDSGKVSFVFPSAIGISRKRKADVAWVFADSSFRSKVRATQDALPVMVSPRRDSSMAAIGLSGKAFPKWKMQTAIGGGPVLVQDGRVQISNNQEAKFAGKAIHDKHPRTAMGYTADNKLIILVIEGRNPAARGASLIETANMLKDLGCVEALNLDGGGSSCLLINGKETIRPSDKVQRSVPAVFEIRLRK